MQKEDKLTEIMAWKRREIESRIRPVRERELTRLSEMARYGKGFYQALAEADHLAVIAEIKRASPSAGAIAAQADAVEQARKYTNAGVDAMSVLTDEKYFSGHLKDLWSVVEFLEEHGRTTPCLRKDFMVHPVQVVEAAEAGARAILIIVRALDDDDIARLHDAARLAGLDALFEIHSEAELERALNHEASLVGINNRNLATFETDLAFSETLIPQLPKSVLAISESGIRTADDAARVRAAGARAVLVGEALMRESDPEPLVQAIQQA